MFCHGVCRIKRLVKDWSDHGLVGTEKVIAVNSYPLELSEKPKPSYEFVVLHILLFSLCYGFLLKCLYMCMYQYSSLNKAQY